MRLAILVLCNACDTKRLAASMRWNKASPYPVFYRSFCDCGQGATIHPRIECLPCCRGIAGRVLDRPEMVTRLKYAYTSLNLSHFTHIMKIDDDTQINYGALEQWISTETAHFATPQNVFGKCEYAWWEKMVFCDGGSGFLAHTALLRRMLPRWPSVGSEDVEFSRTAVDLGAKLIHNNRFNMMCDKLLSQVITRHHCPPSVL
jgi:hypothetical protein